MRAHLFANACFAVGLSLVLTVIGFACATGPTTSITQVWKADMGGPEAAMHKVLVIGSNMSEPNRRTVEEAFVKAFADRGVDATPSYQFFDGPLPDRDQARALTRKAGFDGLLALVLHGVHERKQYVPGGYTGDFWGGEYGSGSWTYEPSYVDTEEAVVFEVTLWDPRMRDALAWSAQTETVDLKSNRAFAKSVADKILPQLEASKFIPPRK